MNNLLCFSRNRSTCVQAIDDETIISTCRMNDTLTDAFVTITVQLPDLEIRNVEGNIHHLFEEKLVDFRETLKGIKGVRIGPGMLKIIKGIIGEGRDIDELTYMVEEACHGVILYFTRDRLLDMPADEEEAVEYFKKMVKENIRMYNRCAAFAPGSPLVEGIEPP